MTTRIAGTYVSPTIGYARVPSGLVGPGTIECSEAGVVIDGLHKTNYLVSLLGIVGFVVGYGAMVVVGSALHVAGGSWMLGFIIGGAAGGCTLGWKLTRARPLHVVVPWTKIRALELDGRGLRFMSKVRPKGEVVFVPRSAAEARAAFGDMQARAR